MNIYTSLIKSIYFKTLIILIVTTFTILGCQKEEDILTPLNNERFEVPLRINAESHFETNNRLSIGGVNGQNSLFRSDNQSQLSPDWERSTTKKFKEPSNDTAAY